MSKSSVKNSTLDDKGMISHVCRMVVASACVVTDLRFSQVPRIARKTIMLKMGQKPTGPAR